MALRQHLMIFSISCITHSTRPAGVTKQSAGSSVYVRGSVPHANTISPCVTRYISEDVYISTDATSDQTLFRCVTSIFLVESPESYAISSLVVLVKSHVWPTNSRRCLVVQPSEFAKVSRCEFNQWAFSVACEWGRHASIHFDPPNTLSDFYNKQTIRRQL
jgi:hypothetical protein